MNRLEEKFLRRERILKLTTMLAIIIGAGVIVLKVDNMLISLVIASVIYYSLNPMVNALERGGLDRGLSILIPFLASGTLVTVGTYLLSPLLKKQIESAQADLPNYVEGFKNIIDKINTLANTYVGPILQTSVTDKGAAYLQNWIQGALTDIPSVAGQIFTVAILAPFFAFFMLRDGRMVVRQLFKLVPNNLFELVLNLFHQINQQMGGFIRARALESIIVGAVVWVGLAMVEFPYSVILAAIAGITNLIPYIGPIIGAIPAFVVALVNQDTTTTLVIVSAIYITAQLIDMLFIIPLVVAKIVNLHPVSVIIVIIIGSQLLGVLGMIISIPVASVIKLTLSAVYNHVIGFRI